MTDDTRQSPARALLERAIAEGLTLGDCLQAFAAGAGDERRYADFARARLARDGAIEIDDPAVVCQADEPGAYVLAWLWVDAAEIWDGPTDSDGAPCRCLNHYRCDNCEQGWTDQWSCACNDSCPSCGAEIEPFDTTELDLAGRPTKNNMPEQPAPTSDAKSQIAERMADLIVHVRRQQGECTDDDLRAAAFTDEQIASCGPLARGFAAVELGDPSLQP